jgi:hypothetical protein
MFQEKERSGVYRLFADAFQFPNNLESKVLDGISKISHVDVSAASGDDLYPLVTKLFGEACYLTLYVHKEPWFCNPSGAATELPPQLRWEFYANYAVVLTQVILACHHECMRLIERYRPRVRIQSLIVDLASSDRNMMSTLMFKPTETAHSANLWSDAVVWNNIEDMIAFENVKRHNTREFFLKILTKFDSSPSQIEEAVKRVGDYMEKWDELLVVAHSIPIEIADQMQERKFTDDVEKILKDLDQLLGMVDTGYRERLITFFVKYKKVSHALLYTLPDFIPKDVHPTTFKSSTAAVADTMATARRVHTFSLVDLVKFDDSDTVDKHDCDTESSVFSKWADDFLPKVVHGSLDIKVWLQDGVNTVLSNFQNSLTSKVFSGMVEIIDSLKLLSSCCSRVSSFVRTFSKYLKFFLSLSGDFKPFVADRLIFSSINENCFIGSKKWQQYWDDVKSRQKSSSSTHDKVDRYSQGENGLNIFFVELLSPISAAAVSFGKDEEKASVLSDPSGSKKTQNDSDSKSEPAVQRSASLEQNVAIAPDSSIESSESNRAHNVSKGKDEEKASVLSDPSGSKKAQDDSDSKSEPAVQRSASLEQNVAIAPDSSIESGESNRAQNVASCSSAASPSPCHGFIEELEPILLFLISVPSIFNAFIHEATNTNTRGFTKEDCLQLLKFIFSDFAAFVKVKFVEMKHINGFFCDLKKTPSFFVNLKDYTQEIEAATTKIKNAALDELKAFGDRVLTETKKVAGSSVIEAMNDFGIESIFGTVASMYSDFASARKSYSQPQRVRQVALFCLQILARVTSDVNVAKELMKRRCLESDSLVQSLVNQTGTDSNLQESIHSSVLQFWCPRNCPGHRLCTFCSSGSGLDAESERSMYFECDADIQEHLKKCMIDLEKERLRAEAATDPRVKQQIILKCKMQSKVLNKLAGNIVDLGAKLSVMMDFIGDVQDQLVGIDSKLLNLQVSIDSIRHDISRLAGLPVIEIIQEHSALELKRLKHLLSKQVYVPPKVAGRMFVKDEIQKSDQELDAKMTAFYQQQRFVNSIMIGCSAMTMKSDYAEAKVSEIADFHRLLDSLHCVKPSDDKQAAYDPSCSRDVDSYNVLKVSALLRFFFPQISDSFSASSKFEGYGRLRLDIIQSCGSQQNDDCAQITLLNARFFNAFDLCTIVVKNLDQTYDDVKLQDTCVKFGIDAKSIKSCKMDKSETKMKSGSVRFGSHKEAFEAVAKMQSKNNKLDGKPLDVSLCMNELQFTELKSTSTYTMYCEVKRRFDSSTVKLWFEFGNSSIFETLRHDSCLSISKTLSEFRLNVDYDKQVPESFCMTDLGNGDGYLNPHQNLNPQMYLMDAFKQFMKRDHDLQNTSCQRNRNVFLLSGSAGSGKSTAVEHLKLYILGEYAEARRREGITVVLLYAPLASLKDPVTNIFEEAAEYSFERKLRRFHVEELREKCRMRDSELEVVFFLDGWDELRPEVQRNLWQSNNLEWYRSKMYDHNSGYPKVVFTCRSETLAEKKTQLSPSDDSQHYVQHFLPVESNNSEKDELSEAVDYFEEWRFVPFSSDRRDYQMKFVTQHLSERFFKFVGVDWQELIEFQREALSLETMVRDIRLVSPCLSVLVAHLARLGCKTLKSDGIKNWIHALVNAVSPDADALLHQTLRKTVPKTNAADISSAPVFMHVDDEDLLISMVAVLAAGIWGNFSHDSSKKEQTKTFYLEQLAQLRSNELWLPSRYDKEFDSIPELRYLTNTPFMVNVVTEVLPELKGQTNAISSIKRELVSSLGEELSSFIMAIFRQMEEKYLGLNVMEKILEGIDNNDDTEPYLSRLITDVVFNVVLEEGNTKKEQKEVTTLKVVKCVSSLDKAAIWQGMDRLFDDNERKQINFFELQKKIQYLKQNVFKVGCHVAYFNDDNVDNIEKGRSEVELCRGGIISFFLTDVKDRYFCPFELAEHQKDQIAIKEELIKFHHLSEQIANKLRPRVVAAMRRRATSRGSIYDKFVNRILHAQVKRSGLDHVQVLQESVQLARHLAYHLSLYNLSKLRRSDRSKFFSEERDTDVFFKDDGLLIAARSAAYIKRGQELSFSHKTLQEYFVAERIMHSLIEAFQAEQILPESLAQKTQADLEKQFVIDFDKLSASESTGSRRASRKHVRIRLHDVKQGVDKDEGSLERLIELVANCPLAEYEFSGSQDKVAVLDFLVDRLFEDESITKYLEVLVHLTWNATPQHPQFYRIKHNLKSIISQKMLRRGDKCMLHEAAQFGSVSLVKFATIAYQRFKETLTAHCSPDYHEDSLSFTLDIKDQFGRTPLYYALVNCRNDIIDLLIPSCDININNALVLAPGPDSKSMRRRASVASQSSMDVNSFSLKVKATSSQATDAVETGASLSREQASLSKQAPIDANSVNARAASSQAAPQLLVPTIDKSMVYLMCEDSILNWFLGNGDINLSEKTLVESVARLMKNKGFDTLGIVFTLHQLLHQIENGLSFEKERNTNKQLFRRLFQMLEIFQIHKLMRDICRRGNSVSSNEASALIAYNATKKSGVFERAGKEEPVNSNPKRSPSDAEMANEEIKYENGASYLGGWLGKKRHHSGRYLFANRSVCDGQWFEDKMQGFGRFDDFVNKDVYLGNWKDNHREGFGECRYENQDVYLGEWKRDMRDGRGVMKLQSGAVIDSIWSADLSECPLDVSSEAGSAVRYMYTLRDVEVFNSPDSSSSVDCVGVLRAGCIFEFIKFADSDLFLKLSAIHYTHLQSNETCFADRFIPHNICEFGWCQVKSSDLLSSPYLGTCDLGKIQPYIYICNNIHNIATTAQFLTVATAAIQNSPHKEEKKQEKKMSSFGSFVADVRISNAKVYFEVELELSSIQEKTTKLFFCTRNFEEQKETSASAGHNPHQSASRDTDSQDDAFSWTVLATSVGPAGTLKGDLPVLLTHTAVTEGTESVVTVCVALDTTCFPRRIQVAVMQGDKCDETHQRDAALFDCFAPFLKPAFTNLSSSSVVNFGQNTDQMPFKYKDQKDSPWLGHNSVWEYCNHPNYEENLSHATNMFASCDVTLTKSKSKDFIFKNYFGTVAFPQGTNILFGTRIVGPAPATQNVAWLSFKCSDAGLLSAEPLSVGDRVLRGQDWKWGDQDENGVGTVVETVDSDGRVTVEWDNGSRQKYIPVPCVSSCTMVHVVAHTL